MASKQGSFLQSFSTLIIKSNTNGECTPWPFLLEAFNQYERYFFAMVKGEYRGLGFVVWGLLFGVCCLGFGGCYQASIFLCHNSNVWLKLFFSSEAKSLLEINSHSLSISGKKVSPSISVCTLVKYTRLAIAMLCL